MLSNTPISTHTHTINTSSLGTITTSTSSGLYNNIIGSNSNIYSNSLSSLSSINSNITLGAGSGTLYGGGYVTYNTGINVYDFEDKTLDIEKLSKLDEEKRNMLFDLFIKFVDCNDYNSKRLMYNTLETYNLFVDKKAYTRKVKISGLLEDK